MNPSIFSKDCDICGRNLSSLKGFISHKKTHEAEHLRQCPECGKTFRDSYMLNRHTKNVHSDSSSVQCDVCKCKIIKSELSKHEQEKHGVTIEKETLYFSSKSDFLSWKEKMEQETKSKYVQHRGSKKRKNGEIVTVLHCHRDGYYHSEGSNLRNLKTMGSNKINGHCPACLVVKEKESVSVDFTKTHVGHTSDIGRLTLTRAEKESIASKIAMKIPLEEILNEIRDSVTDNQVNRLHLTQKKDLFNIIEQFNLNKEVYHKNDYTSVDSWVKQMQSTSEVVRFYKPQGETLESYPYLKSEDFCLIIANNAQLSLLQKYGSDVLCIDGTHGLNGYDFELYTLLVLDDLREGFPCSFMLSNRSDSLIMEHYFRILKSVMDTDLVPKYFMSDMAESFFNGWSAVYPGSDTQRLFCSWHVDKAWRQNLNKIPQKEQQAQIYKQIRVLMVERDTLTFQIMALNFMKQLFSDKDTRSFACYFEKFINDPHPWAYCYRLNAGINTNMHLENIHKNIKYFYLKGRKVHRLDKGIHALMTYIRDKIFDRLITFHKGKLTKKLSDIRARHKTSDEMGNDLAQRTGENRWIVSSSNRTELYTVEVNNRDCTCNLRCNHCSACIHYYNCSCMDAAIKWNMCKHIHLICRLEANSLQPPEFQTSSSSQVVNIVENEVLSRQISKPSSKKSSSTCKSHNKES